MSEKQTVWCVADTGHDFSTAEQRGKLRFIFNDKINVFASDQLCNDIRDKLRDSTEDDMLIPSGNALAACIAFATLLEKHSRVNVLIYSFKNECYEYRSVRKQQLLDGQG